MKLREQLRKLLSNISSLRLQENMQQMPEFSQRHLHDSMPSKHPYGQYSSLCMWLFFKLILFK